MEKESAPATTGGTGFLIVQVTTANSAIPLEGAAVTVQRANGEIVRVLRSRKDGRTERIPLDTPPRSGALSPDAGPAFTPYRVEVSLPEYGTTIYGNVPVFDGITAIQQANLTPLPENGYPDGFTTASPRALDAPADTRL